MRSPREIIARKRDRQSLDEGEIAAFVAGLASGKVGEGQAAAFAMAVFLNGMDAAECVALTRAMAGSGRMMRWDGLPGPVLDKHSTGGIGDTVSLTLAPAIAACGGFVPMIAGRGLGHTGGTIDKLEAIPGYDTAPSQETFARTVREVGAAIIGQTADLAPADRRLYAVRDVTATVESIPLITASILAKKLAAGLDSLVLDVKVGSGAFMATRGHAEALARSLVSVANGAGLKASALLTDMDQPLAPNAGNALETRLAIDMLAGRAEVPRLMEAVLALGAEMLRLGGIEPGEGAARARLAHAIADGSAAERFARMVAALGGPADIVERPEAHLAEAPHIVSVAPAQAGSIREIDTRALGLAVVALGGGREAAEDRIDPRVGLSGLAGLGEPVGPEKPLAFVHAAGMDAAETAAAAVRAAYRIGDDAPPTRAVVLGRIDAATEQGSA